MLRSICANTQEICFDDSFMKILQTSPFSWHVLPHSPFSNVPIAASTSLNIRTYGDENRKYRAPASQALQEE